MPYIGNTTSDFSVDTGNITNRAVTALKLSPSSVGSNGQVLSVDGSGNLQWGNDANAPEGTAVLSTGESGTTKYLRVDGDGTCSWQLAVDATKTTLTGSTNNTITTVTGANAITGEANLTFNDSVLSIINTSNLGDAFLYIKAGEAGASVIELQADEADDNNDLWRIQNAGDSKLGFRSKESGSWVEKLGITADGNTTFAGSLIISEDNAIHLKGATDSDLDSIVRESSGNALLINSRNDAILNIDSNGDSTDAHFAVAHGAATSGSTELFRIDESCRVGIGGNGIGNGLGVYLRRSSPTTTHFYEASDGTKAMIAGVDSTLDYVKIGSLTAHRLGLVASNGEKISVLTDGKVGIGTTAPSTILEVVGANETTFDHLSTLIVRGTDAYNSGNAGAGISFAGKYQSGGNSTTLAQISGIKEDTGDGTYDGALTFGVRNDAEGVNIERMRISSTGKIHSPNAVQSGGNSTSGFQFDAVDTSCVLGIQGKSAANGGATGNALFQGWFGSSNTFRVNCDGLIKTSKGVDFSGAQSNAAGMTSETLDSYEEGTFTPTFSQGISVSTWSNQVGTYTKIGNLVTCNIYMRSHTSTTDANDVIIANLPFTCNGTGNNEGGGYLKYTNGFFGTTVDAAIFHALPWVSLNTSNVRFHRPSDGANVSGNNCTPDAKYIIFNVQYFVG